MTRVLITGATGYIGSHCLQSLRRANEEIHAVTSRSKPDDPTIHWHQADLLAPQQVRQLLSDVRPTHLLHLAWYVEHGKYWTSPENFRWVQASLELLRTFTDCGGQRVVMAGTCAEYDWQYGFCSELVTPTQPASTYGRCKHALQSLLMAYAESASLSAAWGRIFFSFGPREPATRLVSSVIRALLRNQPAPCSHGNQLRDFLYVQDLADAFVALLMSTVTGPVNLGSGIPIALREVVSEIGQQIGSPDLIQFGAYPAPDDPPLLVADVRRLRTSVGWSPQYNLSTGIAETIDWWRGHLNGINT